MPTWEKPTVYPPTLPIHPWLHPQHDQGECLPIPSTHPSQSTHPPSLPPHTHSYIDTHPLTNRIHGHQQGPRHVPAPKLPLPGHAESYNPPPEYLPTPVLYPYTCVWCRARARVCIRMCRDIYVCICAHGMAGDTATAGRGKRADHASLCLSSSRKRRRRRFYRASVSTRRLVLLKKGTGAHGLLAASSGHGCRGIFCFDAVRRAGGDVYIV